MREDLDDLLTVHHFLNVALRTSDRLLLPDEVLCRPAADLLRDEEHQRDAEKHEERHPDAVPEHYSEHADDYGSRRDQRGKRLRDELTQRVDIVRVVAHDIAVLVRIEILYRQILHPVEHTPAELAEKALRDIRHELGIDSDRDDREKIQRDKYQYLGDDLSFSRFPVAAEIPVLYRGYDLLDKYRRYSRNRGREEYTEYRQRDKSGIIREQKLYSPSESSGSRLRSALRRAVLSFFSFRHSLSLPSSVVYRPRGRSRSLKAARCECPCRRSCRCP